MSAGSFVRMVGSEILRLSGELRCWLFGHEWSAWTTEATYLGRIGASPRPVRRRRCLRCGEPDAVIGPAAFPERF